VAKGGNEDSPAAILQTALAGLGGIERFVKPGQTVAIKPNATWAYPPHSASSTDPEFLRAVIEAVKAAGAKRIIVMDHCAIDPGTAETLRVSGIGALLNTLDVEQVFPDRRLASKDLFTQVDLPQGQEYKQLRVIKAAVDADVRINLAVAKTHNVTRLTLSMKHMMGFMEEPQLLHAWLYKGIADLNTSSPIQAQLHLLEAIRVRVPFGDYVVCAGPETDESDPRVVKRLNQVVAGTDPCLVDAYACINYFDIRPRELAYLSVAAQAKVGDVNVEKAIQTGKLLEFNVGDIQPTATPSATPTAALVEISTSTPPSSTMATNAKPVTPELAATHTPRPTTTQDAASSLPAVGRATPGAVLGSVINPGPFLSVALIPAAAVVAGAGLVALHQMHQNEEKPRSVKEIDEHEQD
jgi:hypothetical protein